MIVLRPHIPPFVWIFNGSAIVLLSGLLVATYFRMAGSSRPAAILILAGAILVAVYLLVIAPLLSSLSFDGHTLIVDLLPYGRKKFEIGQIRSIQYADIRKDSDYRPALRTLGTSLGRFKTGHFLLSTRRPAIVMTDRTRVLVIRTDDTDILVGHDLCGELEYALRKALGEK